MNSASSGSVERDPRTSVQQRQARFRRFSFHEGFWRLALAWLAFCTACSIACSSCPLSVVHPLDREVSGVSVSLRVTARKATVSFLNPREKARPRVRRILREHLERAGTFRAIVAPGQGEMDLSVEIIEYAHGRGHSSNAICALEVQLRTTPEKRLVTQFTVIGRAVHPASKADWWRTEQRAVDEAANQLVAYLSGSRQ